MLAEPADVQIFAEFADVQMLALFAGVQIQRAPYCTNA